MRRCRSPRAVHAASPRSATSRRQRSTSSSAIPCSRQTCAGRCPPLTTRCTAASLNSRLKVRPRAIETPPSGCRPNRHIRRVDFGDGSLLGVLSTVGPSRERVRLVTDPPIPFIERINSPLPELGEGLGMRVNRLGIRFVNRRMPHGKSPSPPPVRGRGSTKVAAARDPFEMTENGRPTVAFIRRTRGRAGIRRRG
jgi:hypothetical protein